MRQSACHTAFMCRKRRGVWRGNAGQRLRANEKPPPGMIRKWRFSLTILVGATGFEPATSATPLQRATKLRHAPLSARQYFNNF